MADEMNKSTPVEEEIEIITLTDENGEDMDFEFLDQIDYEGKRYAVLLPPIEDVEGEEENEDEEVLILQVEEDGNDEAESYVFVDDDDILSAVFDIFKEKFKDEFDSQKNKTIEPGSFQTKKIPRKHIKNMLSEYLFSLAKKNFCAKFLL